jgi:hypothetical protein
MKIYEFPNETTAQACLAQVNELGATLFEGLGYTVERVNGDPVLIGKNAQTGDDVESAKTTSWDVVKESPVGTYYFTSLAENNNITVEQATATTAQLQGVFGFVEVESLA